MTELHNNALVIEHTKILSKLTEQIESICLKLTRLERFIDDKFSQRDRELETAKIEMDRRLDGLNHLNAQLVQTRTENTEKVHELNNAFMAVKEGILKLEGRVDNLSSLVSLRSEKEARHEGRVEGMGVYQVVFITAMISALMGIILHYVFKF